MFNSITAIRPYAKAAFEYADENSKLSNWINMLTIAANISQEPLLTDVMSSDIKSETLAELFIAICGDKLDQAGQNFVRILAMNGRLHLLPKVLELFTSYLEQKESIKEVDIVTADKLTATQLEKISKVMQQRLSCKVKLNCSIDKSIIAGIIIRTGDMVMDGSVSGRLQRLTDNLLA